jgi:hypothetical protein
MHTHYAPTKLGLEALTPAGPAFIRTGLCGGRIGCNSGDSEIEKGGLRRENVFVFRPGQYFTCHTAPEAGKPTPKAKKAEFTLPPAALSDMQYC